MNKVLHGDCLEELKKLPENSVDAVVTDPPYELGFMGKSWDSTGIANNVEMWKETLRVLKPGGHLLAFSGTRTYHRMASAIEDAGFEVRDMIEWVYGSGFPKSLNIGKAVARLQGENIPKTKGFNVAGQGIGLNPNRELRSDHPNYVKPTYDNEWEGWGTALKPAHEPICMARKPLAEKTVAENVLKYGTGGINIDESRVESTEFSKDLGTKRPQSEDYVFKSFDENTRPSGSGASSSLGRFPANLIHDNSEEVRECFPNESERFFKSIIYQAKASKSERNKGCEDMPDKRVNYMAKANGTGEASMDTFSSISKNYHPTVKPIALMEYLIKMVTKEGQTVLDPFGGSGTTGVACKNTGRNYILIEKEKEYIDIINNRLSQ